MSKKPETITINGTEYAGFCFYDGPSAITGEPIIGLITLNTSNPKTGDMFQVWILTRDIAPHEARSESLSTGRTSAVCGNCPVMSICYVNLAGPTGIWFRFHRGLYPFLDLNDPTAVAILASKPARLGAYGEPAALPYQTARTLADLADGWTGYTHLYETCDPRFADLLMASCEDQRTREIAHARGFRTFTIITENAEPSIGEIICPELSGRTDCANCQLCNGKQTTADRRKDIAMPIHGTSAKRFTLDRGGVYLQPVRITN